MFPFINYCNIVWGATYPTYLNSILLIQKRYLRMISHSSIYAPSAPLFMQYSILPIVKLNTYQTCLFIHKYMNRFQDLPDTFLNFFIFTTNVHSYETRHSHNSLFLPFSRTSGHQTSLCFRGPSLWSDLSVALRSIPSPLTFKRRLKDHLVFS